VYLTPHFWTSDGKATDPAKIIQPDLSKWSYRNQVITTRFLRPFWLFLGVKLTEVLFRRDRRYAQIMRDSILTSIRVVLAEIWEFLFDTKFVGQGSFSRIMGSKTL
jgi:anaerobic magnesium-protoporphyrin IX monomethyl ester cyclase